MVNLYTLSYEEQLKHELWLNKKEAILERDNYRCQEPGCFSTVELHVHHKYYKTELLAWEYPDSALITLCCKHHLAKHGKHQAKGKVKFLANRREFYRQRALERIHGHKKL